MTSLRDLAPAIISRYPEGKSRSALLPLLHAAQEREGHVPPESMQEIADVLGISAAEVAGVASFYHMLKLKPKGRHVVSVCHNIACTLLGAERLVRALELNLGTSAGGTSPDGEITLERAECLAACEMAPMIQIDYDQMIGPLTADEALALVADLRKGDHRAEAPISPVDAVTASPGAAQREDEPPTDVEARFPPGEPPLERKPPAEPSQVEPAAFDEPFLVDTIEEDHE